MNDKVRRHLEGGCPECDRAVRFWRKVGDLIRPYPEPGEDDPPAEAHARAVALFRRRPGGSARRPLLEVLAELVLDTSAAPLPAGARPSRTAERQLLFSVEGFDIDVRLRPGERGDAVRLTGQMLPGGGGFLDSDRLQAWLTGPSGEMVSLPVTGFGEFSADGLAPGHQIVELVLDNQITYRLRFTL